MAQIGDLAVGGTISLGTPHTDGSSDDWFRSEYLVLWAFNPAATRIPDAHYVHEARYRGARVVSIAPDYSQSSIHADLWLSVRQVVVEENLHREDYLVEQTDLPFLVREDDGRFLRESDMVEGGGEERFAFWDEATRELVWAPGTAGSSEQTLALPEGVRPALEAACAEAALDGDGLRAACAALAAGSAADGERGAAIAAWLADPARRVAEFGAYTGVFLTRDRHPRKTLITKAAAALAPDAAKQPT